LAEELITLSKCAFSQLSGLSFLERSPHKTTTLLSILFPWLL
jgi:hypothetical protein